MSDNPTAAYARKLSLILVLLILGGTIIVIIAGVGLDEEKKDKNTQNRDAAVTERLAPVGNVNTGEPFVMEGAAAAEVKGTIAKAAPTATASPTAETGAAVAAATPAMGDGRGKEVYDAACFVCHATGVAGAPKFGDPVGWNARIAQGTDTLYTHAIKGFMGEAGLMPPKGGRMDYSDDDVKAAVDYMVVKASQ